jgi:IS30 family transposase
MACHRELARNTNMRVYFCDPHSPWQRGSCENTNGFRGLGHWSLARRLRAER